MMNGATPGRDPGLVSEAHMITCDTSSYSALIISIEKLVPHTVPALMHADNAHTQRTQAGRQARMHAHTHAGPQAHRRRPTWNKEVQRDSADTQKHY